MKRRVVSILFLLSLALHLCLQTALAERIGSLSEGPPALMGNVLSNMNYVTVEARRLANPKVLWLNFDLLRQRGIEFPENGLTPEFEGEIYDAFAYAAVSRHDSPSNFLSQVREFFADRYGGYGIGVNWGSGRAASSGRIQNKGIAATALVGAGQSFDHAHGHASIEEGIREAVWGELLTMEMPHGANRVVALIDTGTYTMWPDGSRQRNVLIIREDPLRPAHFMRAGSWGGNWLSNSELGRVRENTRNILLALPQPDDSGGSEAKRFLSGMEEYTRRIARQHAAAYANGFFHGATSQSNIEITGRFLDFGTMTAQSGHDRIRVLEHHSPAGDISEIYNILIKSFTEEITQYLPVEIKRTVSTFLSGDLMKIFENEYNRILQREFMKLTGIPASFFELYPGRRQAAGAFGEMINQVFNWWLASSGVYRLGVNVDRAVPEKPSGFNLRRLLIRLAEGNYNDINSLETILNSEMPYFPEYRRKQLAESYSTLMKEAASHAGQNLVPERNFQRLVRENVRLRNTPRPAVYRSNMMQENIQLIDDYLRSGDRSAIWNSINERVASSRRDFSAWEHDAPFSAVLGETRNPLYGTSVRRVYDAREGSYQLEIEAPISDGHLEFFGNRIEASDADRLLLRHSTDNWRSFQEARASFSHDRRSLRFVLPDPRIPGRSTSDPWEGTVEMALHPPDDSHWWKMPGSTDNIRVQVARNHFV
ncbi:MAG: YdiU family protein, partial [Oligoflexales bacterium]|nr:YdiU family protein [Oligoflexales bacterium]